MKKNILTMIVAVAATNINAQLVVDSLGHVGIGTDTPKSLLSVGESGDTITVIRCSVVGKAKIFKPFATPLGVEFVINRGLIE